MVNLNTPSTRSFLYRKTKPFTKAEFRFKTALAEFAGKHLMARLQGRTAARPGVNRYSGINARVTGEAVYLEAIMVNDIEWGGFGFDFARLVPAASGLYNLALRRGEDWIRAENSTVAAASNYFFGTSAFPRASDWIPVARGKTFEECVCIIEEGLQISDKSMDLLASAMSSRGPSTRKNGVRTVEDAVA